MNNLNVENIIVTYLPKYIDVHKRIICNEYDEMYKFLNAFQKEFSDKETDVLLEIDSYKPISEICDEERTKEILEEIKANPAANNIMDIRGLGYEEIKDVFLKALDIKPNVYILSKENRILRSNYKTRGGYCKNLIIVDDLSNFQRFIKNMNEKYPITEESKDEEEIKLLDINNWNITNDFMDMCSVNEHIDSKDSSFVKLFDCSNGNYGDFEQEIIDQCFSLGIKFERTDLFKFYMLGNDISESIIIKSDWNKFNSITTDSFKENSIEVFDHSLYRRFLSSSFNEDTRKILTKRMENNDTYFIDLDEVNINDAKTRMIKYQNEVLSKHKKKKVILCYEGIANASLEEIKSLSRPKDRIFTGNFDENSAKEINEMFENSILEQYGEDGETVEDVLDRLDNMENPAIASISLLNQYDFTDTEWQEIIDNYSSIADYNDIIENLWEYHQEYAD